MLFFSKKMKNFFKIEFGPIVKRCKRQKCLRKIFTGSPKKHETGKTTLKLLTDILERMKEHSIKTNM